MGIHTSIFYFADGTDIFPTGSLPGGLGWLGRRVRVILPSCTVCKIKNTFPSVSHTGFNYPNTS